MKILSVLVLTSLITLGWQTKAAAAGAQQGWQFDPKFMYLIEKTQNGGSTTDVNRLLLDATLGYKFSNPIFFGATYGYDNKSTTNGSTTHDVYSGYGPTFGVMADNIYLLFTYYFSSQYQNEAPGGTTTYTNGNGYQLDFAYLFSVGSSWSLGPSLSFRSLHYSSVQNAGGGSGSADLTYTTLLPYVAFQFAF